MDAAERKYLFDTIERMNTADQIGDAVGSCDVLDVDEEIARRVILLRRTSLC